MTLSREDETIGPQEQEFARAILLGFGDHLKPRTPFEVKLLALLLQDFADSHSDATFRALISAGSLKDLRWTTLHKWTTTLQDFVEPVGLRDLLIQTMNTGEWLFEPINRSWAAPIRNERAYFMAARAAQTMHAKYRQLGELDVQCWAAIAEDNKYQYLAGSAQYATRYASMCGTRGAEPVRMRVVGTGKPEDVNVARETPGFHLGWQYAGGEKRLPILVWPDWTRFAVSFDCDPVELQKRGDGRIVQLDITKEAL